MSAADLFAGFDQEELDHLAERILIVFVATADLTRPEEGPESGAALLFQVAWIKATLMSLVGFIGLPEHSREYQEQLLDGAVAFLRRECAATVSSHG